jgi:hypothetical protein
MVRYCSISPLEPITPKVSVCGGSCEGEEDSLGEASSGEELEPDGPDVGSDVDESQAASTPEARRAAARKVAPRVRLVLPRTAETLTAGR